MELLFAGLAGLAIGALAAFATRHRDLIGAVLPAAIGGITALLAWELLTWLGAVPGFGWLAYDRAWIWWITLAVTAIVSVWTVAALGSRRAARDADLLDRLSHVGRTRPRRRTAATSVADDAEREDEAGADIADEHDTADEAATAHDDSVLDADEASSDPADEDDEESAEAPGGATAAGRSASARRAR